MGPPRTLQTELAAKALQEFGSAMPKVVQTPAPPRITEQRLFPDSAEQSFDTSGTLNFVEQKLRWVAPGFNTEHWASPPCGVWCVLQRESPRLLAEQRWLTAKAIAEHSWGRS